MSSVMRFFGGVAGFFFAAVAFASPPSNHLSRHQYNHHNHGRYLERDLAYIAGAAVVGTIIYNASRPSVEYIPAQPPVIYEPAPPQPIRYYDTRWVYFPQCGCYRNVVVEVYR